MSESASHSSSAPTDEVVRKSVRGAATTTVAGLLGRAAGLLTTLLVTHFVQKNEYGQANLALIVATVVNALTLFAPQQALLTRREHFEEAASLVQTYLLWLGVAVFGSLLWLGKPLLGLLHQPSALPLLQLYCVALWLERAALIPAVKLRYRLQFGDLVRVDLLGDALYVVVTMGSAVAGLGAVSLPLGVLARQLTRVLVLRLLLDMPVLPGWPEPLSAESKRLLRDLWRMTWPIYLSSLVELSTLYMDNVFVGRFYSIGAQGIYAVGYTIVMTPSETIAVYAASAMVRALGLSDRSARQHNYLQGLRYVSLFLVPLAVGAALVASTFEVALLPERWRGVAGVMQWLAIGAMSLGFHRMAFAQLTALHHSRMAGLIYATQLLSFVTGLVVVALTDPSRLQMERVALAVSLALLLASACGTAMTVWVDELPLRRLAQALGPALLSTTGMAVVLLALRPVWNWAHVAATPLRLGAEVAVGAAVYTACLRVFFPSLLHEVRSFISRRK
ncbi:MAG: oligosaccharide flippase family protein [Polyangia bacterium]|jgi:PST family polysaccharide transporter